MEDNQSVLINFKEKEYNIPIPINYQDLFSNFIEKFKADPDGQYEFYFLRTNNNDKIYLNDIMDYQFKKNISILENEEGLIIYVKDKNDNEINDENKKYDSLQDNNNFSKELVKYGNILKDIINKNQKLVDKTDKLNIKESINVFLNINNNDFVGKGMNKIHNHFFDKEDNKIKESNDENENSYDKILELENKFENLKLYNEKNNDNIDLIIKKIEERYEEKKRIEIDKIKNKYQKELEEQKNKYMELEKKYKNIQKKNKDDILNEVISENDKNLDKINKLKNEVDKLKKENDLKQKIINIYENDKGKILDLFNKQKNLIEELKKKKE